ncbi:MAG: hypothetical protein WD969_01740 [Paracoccaceae bacterium]
MNIDDLKSVAGQLLYRELPEELRYLDPAAPGELGDLEACLHGFGHLLDLMRGTAEQAYADAFAEAADNGREIQVWMIPYLAELVGAELRAPDPAARRRELNNSVVWFKSKGSLEAVDEIGDTIGGAETVVVEGWRRTLTTPRMGLPPFTAPPKPAIDGDPSTSITGLPLGAPDIRYQNRAVEDASGSNPLFELKRTLRDGFGRATIAETRFWRPRALRGAPCFPGAYDDVAARTPDLRSGEFGAVGPHPSRANLHVRPPEGFFAAGINGASVAPTTADIAIDPAETSRQVFRPVEVFRALGLLDDPAVDDLRIEGEVVLPERIIVAGDLTVPAGVDVLFEDLMFTGAVRLDDAGARVEFRRCAVATLAVNAPTTAPAVIAADCLFGTITGGVGFAQLVHCTVLGDVALERLWASDCIFNGALVDLDCSGDETCIRFSRVADLGALAGCGAEKSPSNTDDDPNFLRLWFDDGGGCVLRPAVFGEPGAGVLDLTSSPAIREGAEDEGEMGAYHHMFHAAQIRALKLKLTDFLPLGQEVAIRYDPYLSRPPARAV